ncbi:MAG: zf-TFIIB domain-containing protein [Hyphomicrobiaceae bacterium]
MADRNGVEIDYCPSCRGVWLDRGELDKIIDLSTLKAQAAPAPPQAFVSPHHQEQRAYPKKKSKESFLSELFDF